MICMFGLAFGIGCLLVYYMLGFLEIVLFLSKSERKADLAHTLLAKKGGFL